jgi:PadR family transcriptional regulator
LTHLQNFYIVVIQNIYIASIACRRCVGKEATVGRQLGLATVTVLRALRDGYRYGFDIMERTGMPSGTVYPALGTLERRGYVRARWEGRHAAASEGRPRRRYYKLTRSGDEALNDAIRRLGALASVDVDIGLAARKRAEA